jgi:hypothetical protein
MPTKALETINRINTKEIIPGMGSRFSSTIPLAREVLV